MRKKSVLITPVAHAKLKELAGQAGESIEETREKVIDAYYRESFLADTNAGYVALRASPKAWAEELAERRVLEGTLADGLDGPK